MFCDQSHLLSRLQEDCTLENVWSMGGLSVLTSAPLMPPYVCFLCASKGQHEVTAQKFLLISLHFLTLFFFFVLVCHCFLMFFVNFFVQMLHCQVCCEPFHQFCLEPAERPTEENKENWCCRRCKFCHVCGRKNKLSKVMRDNPSICLF